MTTTVLAHAGATPLLGLPKLRRTVPDRDVAGDLAVGPDAGADTSITEDAAWAPLRDVSLLIAPTEIWLDAPRALTASYAALLDNACEVFRAGSGRTFRAASRSIKGTYGNEVLRPLTGADCSIIYVSGALYDDMVTSASIGRLTVTYSPTEGPGAVETVLDLARRLEVTEAEIYRAAGIKGRTFKHWKKKTGTVPRPESLGTLWSLASAVDDLTEHLVDQNPAEWLRGRTERFAALREGRLRQLVDESLGLLAVSAESTSHMEGVVVIEDDEDLRGVAATTDPQTATRDAAQISSWVLADETPTKVVLD